MTNELNRRAEKYEKAHRRSSIWHRIISILSAITVFITTYAMILPAITMEPSPGLKMANEFRYEDDQILLIAQVTGRAALESEADASMALSARFVQMQVTPLDPDSSVREAYLQYAQDNIPQDNLLDLLTLKLEFTYKGKPLNMTNCQIQVQIIAKDTMLDPDISTMTPLSVLPYSSPVEADSGSVMALTAFQGVNSDLSQQSTGFQTDASQPLTVSTLLNGNTLAVALYSTVNPTFTVQYYTYTEVLAQSGDTALDEIDTSGGQLPVNGGPNNMTQIWLNSIGNGKYVLATETKLLELHKSITDFQYVKAPGVAYVDRLRENGNYTLSEVWVLKSGKSASSVNPDDWTAYAPTVGFTNRESSAGANRICITDDMVIRLVYTETTGSYTNAADFYDYDISSGSHTVSGGVTTARTANYGINSFSAASGTVKYAFGNSNTNTDYGLAEWTQNGVVNTPNQYNQANSSYDGCTFGLVTGINDDGTMIFADGISAPVLFGRTDGTGKTYYDDYSLQFTRSGDTYTLVAVNGTDTKNLDQFNNPSPYSGKTYTHIYTNNFWPMDSAPSWGASGHDPKFGNYTAYSNKTIMAQGSSYTSAFPASDDGVDHNSYFGMQYCLTFELTEDYTGPLDYVFYGDDDMWVFLDGQLVCDIGGVHSSVGQYVNLRDYIDQMPDDEKYGLHTLYFCYTERGASGSSCYMRFTLPSVTIDTPQVQSNTLELEKKVHNATTDQEFEFTIELTDADGNALLDDYSYTRYDAEGIVIENGIINSTEKTVKLRGSEKLTIDYLPTGTKFLIRETAADGFVTTYSINGGTVIEGTTATGTIQADVKVLFINSSGPLLPETGGTGTWLYTLPMALAVVFALSLPLVNKIRRKYRRTN